MASRNVLTVSSAQRRPELPEGWTLSSGKLSRAMIRSAGLIPLCLLRRHPL